MRVVVGRHGSSADIQVPSRFNFVSRAHARISAFPGGRYLLEDLNSSNGTFVLAHGMWEQVTRADVDASTPILLADYQTSIAELLRSLPGLAERKPPAPAPQPIPHYQPAPYVPDPSPPSGAQVGSRRSANRGAAQDGRSRRSRARADHAARAAAGHSTAGDRGSQGALPGAGRVRCLPDARAVRAQRDHHAARRPGQLSDHRAGPGGRERHGGAHRRYRQRHPRLHGDVRAAQVALRPQRAQSGGGLQHLRQHVLRLLHLGRRPRENGAVGHHRVIGAADHLRPRRHGWRLSPSSFTSGAPFSSCAGARCFSSSASASRSASCTASSWPRWGC